MIPLYTRGADRHKLTVLPATDAINKNTVEKDIAMQIKKLVRCAIAKLQLPATVSDVCVIDGRAKRPDLALHRWPQLWKLCHARYVETAQHYEEAYVDDDACLQKRSTSSTSISAITLSFSSRPNEFARVNGISVSTRLRSPEHEHDR